MPNSKYLGEFPVDVASHPKYEHYTAQDWSLLFMERYGQIDGSHHKAWVLDQVARILKGTLVIVTTAKWENGYEEDRFDLGEPSPEYQAWVEAMLDRDAEGEPQYSYDIGIPP